MAFERTAAGQSNRAAFLGVDLVCYVEGEEGTDYGLDVAFWSGVLNAISPNTKVHFAPRGGKPIVEALAREIVELGVGNTLAAMDRDYSEFRHGRFIDDPRVFYTYGYSWENDVYCTHQLSLIAARLSRTIVLPTEHADKLAVDHVNLSSKIGRIVFADFVAILKGGSVFDREKPGRYTALDGDGRPVPCIERCKADVRKAVDTLRGRVMRQSAGFPSEGARYLWGKAYEHYVRVSLQKTVREYSGRSFNIDHLRDIAIVCFCQCLASGQNTSTLDHYRKSWARLGI